MPNLSTIKYLAVALLPFTGAVILGRFLYWGIGLPLEAAVCITGIPAFMLTIVLLWCCAPWESDRG